MTNVDVATGRALIDSMSNEVIVRDDSIRRSCPLNQWTTTAQSSQP